MKSSKKHPGDTQLVTHTLKPSDKLSGKIESALSQKRTAEGLSEAKGLVAAALDEFAADPRLKPLAAAFPEAKGGASALLSAAQVKTAFKKLAEGVKRLQTAAQGAERVSHQEGAEVSAFDRKMMKGVIRLCGVSFSELNTPAATIITAGDKIVAVGMNRAYNPLPEYDRHGEMEALRALKQRTYTGIAQILVLHRQRGGALSPRSQEILKKLEAQGLMKDQSLGLNPAKLEKQGFFSAAKIEKYERQLDAAVKEGSCFQRDEDGNLHGRPQQVFETAMSQGTFGAKDVADWEVFDRLHSRDPTMKLALYTSLEPCGMCLQNCTSHGQIGRVVYGARDEFGGGISTLEKYPEAYFSMGRVPYELVGGVEGEKAQVLYDKFFNEVYPYVRVDEDPPPEVLKALAKEFAQA